MAMNLSEQVASLFWSNVNSIYIWQLCFEDLNIHHKLLERVLANLPAEIGSMKFKYEGAGEYFIALFTKNYENQGAYKNEAQVLNKLADTNAIRFFGVEGAEGVLEGIEKWQQYPDKESLVMVAGYLMSNFMLTPIEVVGIGSAEPLVIRGIEDRDLYIKALEKYRTMAPDLQATLDTRVPVLFDNLLKYMKEANYNVAGVILTEANFWEGHKLLKERRISHIGIKINSSGPSNIGSLRKALHNQPRTEAEANLIKMFAGP